LSQYLFLSDEWLEESRRIREEYKDRVPQIPVSVRMNQIINDVPFGPGVIRAYVDTSSGQLDIETGELPTPDLTVTLNYDTAKAILVDGDSQAAMNAFLGGRIKVDGDITKLLALQSGAAGGSSNSGAADLVKRIQAITI